MIDEQRVKSFVSKLLLFGEYGLMFGAKALAIPFAAYFGQLDQGESLTDDEDQKRSHDELKRFLAWFRDKKINEELYFPLKEEALIKALDEHWYFRSNVPLQYGVGSSGALCAALYDRFGTFDRKMLTENPKITIQLKHDFMLMESFFHGKSSGLDPLVSFLNCPLLYKNKEVVFPSLKLDNLSWSVYLIDTLKSSATAPLVKLFMHKMKDPVFMEIFKRDYIRANDGAIEAFIENDPVKLFNCLAEITRFQLTHFKEMIPPAFRLLIEELLEQKIYVKLLGSGGGGFLQVFSEKPLDPDQLKNSLKVI